MISPEPTTHGAPPERTQGATDEAQQYLTFLLGMKPLRWTSAPYARSSNPVP